MTDQLETEYREKLIKDSVLILAQEIHTVETMTKELRTHVINARWQPTMNLVEIILLCCILVALVMK